jgi:hypothetical protein
VYAQTALLLLMALVIVTCEAGTGSGASDAASEVEKMVADSRFVFQGTIRKLHAATMPEVRVSPNTAIVRIDELLHGVDEFTHYVGKDITVELAQAPSAKVGQVAIFFTNGAVYGSSLAVREVGRLEVTAEGALGLRKQVSAAHQSKADMDVQRAIRTASLIVAGKVAGVKKRVEEANQPSPESGSEHDPQWREAEIIVDSVEKGDAKLKKVVVVYPGSKDVMWYKSPKFTAGQEGIWILHKNQMKGLKVKDYTALDPADFQPKAKVERVRQLIKAVAD